MSTDDQEYAYRKRAIFDGMSKRGQERILRIGYDNWEPFQEPKDPREIIFSPASQAANAMLKSFFSEQPMGSREESVAMTKELFDLCRGLLQGEERARVLFRFCLWYRDHAAEPGKGL